MFPVSGDFGQCEILCVRNVWAQLLIPELVRESRIGMRNAVYSIRRKEYAIFRQEGLFFENGSVNSTMILLAFEKDAKAAGESMKTPPNHGGIS